MAVILIPSLLQQSTAGKRKLQVQASTVIEALEKAACDFSGLSNALFNGEGLINTYIKIFVNKRDIRLLDGLKTRVFDEDEIFLVLPMTGG